MKRFKNGTLIFIIGLIGLTAVLCFELYDHYANLNAQGYTPQEISAMELQPVNINTAGADELSALPGLTDKQIQSILAYRAEHGDFSDIKELLKVPGIGKVTYQRIAIGVTVE